MKLEAKSWIPNQLYEISNKLLFTIRNQTYLQINFTWDFQIHQLRVYDRMVTFTNNHSFFPNENIILTEK